MKGLVRCDASTIVVFTQLDKRAEAFGQIVAKQGVKMHISTAQQLQKPCAFGTMFIYCGDKFRKQRYSRFGIASAGISYSFG